MFMCIFQVRVVVSGLAALINTSFNTKGRPIDPRFSRAYRALYWLYVELFYS